MERSHQSINYNSNFGWWIWITSVQANRCYMSFFVGGNHVIHFPNLFGSNWVTCAVCLGINAHGGGFVMWICNLLFMDNVANLIRKLVVGAKVLYYLWSERNGRRHGCGYRCYNHVINDVVTRVRSKVSVLGLRRRRGDGTRGLDFWSSTLLAGLVSGSCG